MPSLLFPANGSRFTPGQLITFYWSSTAGAASYEIQIDDSSTISAPFVVDRPGLNDRTWTSSTLPTRQLWWRARAIDAAGMPGAWSSVRSLEVKN